MSNPPEQDRPIERYAWTALVACVAAVPLAVSKLPFLEAPLTFDAFAFPQNVALAVGTAIALALWAAACVAGQARASLSKPMIPFGLFVAWAAVATVAGYEPLRSLFGTSLGALSLVNILAFSAVGFLTLQSARSARRMRTLTWAVVASASVVALIALAQQLFGADVFGLPQTEAWLVGRGFSTMGNPDHLGTFLVMPVLLSAFLVLREEGRNERIAAGAGLGILLTALTGTLTRGAWIAALAGGLVAVGLLWRAGAAWAPRSRILTLAAVCAAAIVLALVASDYTDLGTRFASQPTVTGTEPASGGVANAVLSDRVNLWRSSLLIAADRPLTGTGPAAFQLGWYPNAIDYSSAGGEGALADDPHSFPVTILATTGIPGLIAYLVAVLWALTLGARNSLALTRGSAPTGKSLYYVAWFVAAVSLHVALLVAAVSTPIALYAFLSLAVLLVPTLRPVAPAAATATHRFVPAVAAGIVGVAVFAAMLPHLSAEVALARALRGGALDRAGFAAASVPWNMDVQKAYYHLRVRELDRALTSGSEDARTDVTALAEELAQAGAKQPREFYYPSVRSQILTDAGSRLRDASFAERAIAAADEALAIMPASIPVRVQKAIALSQVQRYDEMVDALAGYWENERTSAYPGILYAQALALSGDSSAAEATFQQLLERFPDARESIEAARQQVAQPGQK